MTDSLIPEVSIGTYAGWDLFYRPADAPPTFVARKGRKERSHPRQDGIVILIANENANESRKKARLEPCQFTLWDDKAQTEERVEITSLSSRGLGIRPAGGGEVRYLELAGYRGWSDRANVLPIVKDGTDLKRLHVAIEMVRRAEAELKAARAELVTNIGVKRVTGDQVEVYFEEEDRLRTAINELNGQRTQAG